MLRFGFFAIAMGQCEAGLVGEWGFDDAGNLGAATLGNDLELVGSAVPAAGIGAGDGAVEIGTGSFFRCAPDIAPNGGSAQFVNEFTVVYDLFLPASSDGQWRSLLQTNDGNSNDGDLWVSTGNNLGVGEIGYSGETLAAETWYRVVFSADIGSNIDGGAPPSSFLSVVTDLAGNSWSFRHASQALDGRHSLYSTANRNLVLFFADENGEDGRVRVGRVQLYDEALSEASARALGGPVLPDPNNREPSVPSQVSGGGDAETGETIEFGFSADDPDGDRVVITVDWGDGKSDTGAFAAAGAETGFSHRWVVPGTFTIRARARDEHGGSSDWAEVGEITVTGEPVVTVLTPPYLQNVRQDGIVIMTETAEDVALEVVYGESLLFGERVVMERVASGGGGWFHRGVVTGLAAGGEYFYRVRVVGGGPVAVAAHFHTAPDGEVDFKFSVWSDSQGHNRGAWSADPLEPTVSMMKHMVASGVAFGLTTGDLAENGGSYSDTRSYYLDRVARHLGTSVPWFAAWGNHDTSNPSAPLRLASDMPSRYRAGFSPGHGSFSFTYANCFFVCLDQFYRSEITNGWLEAQLASDEAREARFRFLGVHVPPYCERWIDGDAELRRTLVPLLENYDVDICFSGHTHEYERGELNHVHYVVTGGGSWLDHTEEIVRDWEHMFVGGAHDVEGMWAQERLPGELGAPRPIVGGLFNEYALLTVREGFLRMDTHGFNADGSEIGVLDSFEIGEDPGPDSDGDGMRDVWERANGLDPESAEGADGALGDPDRDGQSNFAELLAGTAANDAGSVLQVNAAELDGGEVRVRWSSVAGRRYRLWVSGDGETWSDLGVEVTGVDGETEHSFARPPGERLLVRVQVD